jgi:hypothetical protein
MAAAARSGVAVGWPRHCCRGRPSLGGESPFSSCTRSPASTPKCGRRRQRPEARLVEFDDEDCLRRPTAVRRFSCKCSNRGERAWTCTRTPAEAARWPTQRAGLNAMDRRGDLALPGAGVRVDLAPQHLACGVAGARRASGVVAGMSPRLARVLFAQPAGLKGRAAALAGAVKTPGYARHQGRSCGNSSRPTPTSAPMAPFVGAVAASLALSEILRLLHGAGVHQVIDIDLLALEQRVACPNPRDFSSFNPGFVAVSEPML